MRAASVVGVVAALLVCSPSQAGVYHLSAVALDDQPGRINHTFGYTGAAADLTATVCATEAAAAFVPHLLSAIAAWNSRTTAVPNCVGFCSVFLDLEDPPPALPPGVPPLRGRSTGPVDAQYILIHELGHCLFGLDHTNDYRPDASQLGGSDFTAAYEEASFTDDGADDVRGTYDDKPTPWPGSRVLHWFRTALNDPYLEVPATIDNTNYTRVIQSLPPSPHHWPTNANRRSSVRLGHGEAQSVMFGLAARRTIFTGLLPDDVNTVAYAQAGLDEVVGGDDYTYTVEFVEDCAGANVQVEMAELPMGTLGECTIPYVDLPTPPGPLRHYAASSSLFPARLKLTSRADVHWTFEFILWDDFELGSTSFWTETVSP